MKINCEREKVTYPELVCSIDSQKWQFLQLACALRITCNIASSNSSFIFAFGYPVVYNKNHTELWMGCSIIFVAQSDWREKRRFVLIVNFISFNVIHLRNPKNQKHRDLFFLVFPVSAQVFDYWVPYYKLQHCFAFYSYLQRPRST